MKQLVTFAAALCLAATVNAEQAKPQAPAQPAPATTGADPIVPGADQAINVRYEIRIREEGVPQPSTKLVSMTGTLYEVSLVRANQGSRNPLNVDANPTSIRDNKVLTKLGIEYSPETPKGPTGSALMPALTVRQNVSVWLDSGKPMVISQSADPMSDRKLIVEVTATIMR